MLKRLCVLFLLWQQTTFAEHTFNADAPAELAQFESMIGSWKIQDYQPQEDGSWVEGPGAKWKWITILDGYAIQDYWRAPLPTQSNSTLTIQEGTNIRIYNPERELWEMAWISNTGQKLDTFTAEKVNESIVMQGRFNGRDSKITFFDMNQNSFKWKLEYEIEGKWREVYRIVGTREH